MIAKSAAAKADGDPGWERMMPRYSLNFLDPHGRISGRFEFHCTSDREAELACEDMADLSAKVLWCGERRIRDWPALVQRMRQERRATL
jgi:hypothetical protein